MNRSVAFACLALLACGGATPAARSAQGVQDAAMGRTFAGQNRCNPANASRPFVIEWDATDASTFESHAASDIVLVHYEGCHLQILDGCRDSVAGALGSYAPVEWTSGALESVAIDDEEDLYSKLPLGAGALGARVKSGEKFRMDYFVSGTRRATREDVHATDLAALPRCVGATHYVYAYNLGAFALGAQASHSVTPALAGGALSSTSRTERQGGVLASCRGDSARAVETCKVPIRLTLRDIDRSSRPTATPAPAPSATGDRDRAAVAHAVDARVKMSARDGAACLVALDAHDAKDPRPGGVSTNPAAELATLRSECLMLAGQCDAGRALYRKALASSSATLGPDQTDRKVDAEASRLCQGDSRSPRDAFLGSVAALHRGAWEERLTAAECRTAYQTFKRFLPAMKRAPEDDDAVKFGPANVRNDAPMCLAKAGECGEAWTVYEEAWRLDPLMSEDSRRIDTAGLRNGFDAVIGRCRGK